ncbi:GNAT family N-acetyltransferase [Chryseomicrobium sp. FSL W7-1435]|uniref:GNAT family N-acetyltransferase n=1 Tax=Chryseomicrobium sp. FSL W7-1435 TaxID=2921704 RepID=UPI00315A208E
MWTCKKFHELTVNELYEALKLRADVFVVEQNCVYPDIDNYDQASLHISYNQDDDLQAYCRIVPAGKYEEVSIGRVIVRKEKRGSGLAQELIKQALQAVESEYGQQPIRLCAQAHLQSFYGSFGFQAISEEFLEDGIPHIYMLKK